MSRAVSTKRSDNDGDSIFRIPPNFYLHVLDFNKNVTRVVTGPLTFVRQDNEKVVFGPEKMVIVPLNFYCIVENPVARNDKGEIIIEETGDARLRYADLEIHLTKPPFPLHPGEVLKQAITQLKIVHANTALRLRAVLDFEDKTYGKRIAGDEWLFEGPGTYIPRKEVEIDETIRATVIRPQHALKLRARKETQDREDNYRVTGEEWIINKVGAYLPGAYEEVVEVVNSYILTDKVALHVRALRTFVDEKEVTRRSGEEWLIKMEDTESHITGVYEEVVGVVDITTLTSRHYCIILDPVGEDGKPQLGQRKLVKGEKSFFLMPGEKLEKGIQNMYILGEDEGLIMRALEEFKDDDDSIKRPGDRWMIRGPAEFVPNVSVEVIAKRKTVPLDENEGIYVRDIKTGKVRSVCGETYMLNQDEELWSKELTPAVEALLTENRDPLASRGDKATAPTTKRDKTKAVTFRVPHNACIQIYDYKDKKARVIFGPELVILGPDEQFTQLSLSGGKPKKPNVIKSLCLLLGPDFCTDIITIETADHARLQLQLSYNWHFEITDKDNPNEGAKLFSVPDFVGDACKAVASRIRGAVAGVQFDDFHKNSARIIRTSVFGQDEKNKVRDRFMFTQNNLIITSIDIQSVEPVDQRTRDSLQKSVQLAIEITTNSQEATARHEAERLEQEAKGRLERQKISDESEAEKARRELLELQALSAAVESSGQAKAEAQSRAEAARIEGTASVDHARLKSQASKIDSESELERLTLAREAELKFLKEQNEIEIHKTRDMSSIESEKFKNMVDTVGSDTIRAIATAGPEMQVKLLQALGLKTTLITDGSNPINLFQTAHGLIGSHALDNPQPPQD